MFLNEDEMKIIYYIVSRNCWACNRAVSPIVDYRHLCVGCNRLDCQHRGALCRLGRLPHHTTFKDFMGFDCPHNLDDGWRDYFKGRKGWAS